jgi:hypothetical protein
MLFRSVRWQGAVACVQNKVRVLFCAIVIQTVGEGRWNGLKATISDPPG